MISREIRPPTIYDALTSCGYRKLDAIAIMGPKHRYVDHLKIRRDIAIHLHNRGYSLSAIARLYQQHHTTVIWLMKGGRSEKRKLDVDARQHISMDGYGQTDLTPC